MNDLYLSPKKLCSVFIFILVHIGLCAQQDAMFRGNARHHVNYTAPDDKIYNKVSWTFQAQGAIRSTAIAVKDLIVFGSNDGYLYALHGGTGKIAWKYNCGSAVNASPACAAGTIYIINAAQELFALQAGSGQLAWKKRIGTYIPYNWGFDYYNPSPVIHKDTLVIASADGQLLSLNRQNGNIFWKTTLPHFIRATPAISDGHIYIGDTNGDMYALDSKNGRQQWKYETYGAALNNDTIGFDRKAILSSAIIDNNMLVFGSRDGFLYCINRLQGTLAWKFDHKVSWIISSPAIINGEVITGTSDGHFVQSVNIATGRETWRTYGAAPIWSSPLIAGNYVYIGGNEGTLHCIHVHTGEKMAHPLCINAKIFSSPVTANEHLYFGADNGIFYCLEPQPVNKQLFKRYVYWDKNNGSVFLRNGVGMLVKDFLSRKGYTVIDQAALAALADSTKNSGRGNIIVLVSSGLPASFLSTDAANTLTQFLASGGIVMDIGNLSLLHDIDTAGNFNGFQFTRCADITGIHYAHNDLRSFGGRFTAQATATGKTMGLNNQWTATSPVDKKDVAVVLGLDEKGRPSSWIKQTGKGKFLQVWVDQAFPEDYNFIDDVLSNIERM